MTIEQRPILRDADHDKAAYSAFAAAQFRILKDYMKVAKLNTYSRVVTLANGVVITCQKSFNREDIFISVPAGGTIPAYTEEVTHEGFILHPRSGGIVIEHYFIYTSDDYGGIITTTGASYGVAGGWSKGETVIDTNYIFPLVDADMASFSYGNKLNVVKKDGAEISRSVTTDYAEFMSTGYYGNLYWVNDAVWDSVRKSWDKPFLSLSWRGSPTRHGRVPSNYNIPGLSLVESVHSSLFADEEEYTTFGTLLYSGGIASHTAPRFSWPDGAALDKCLVLGAMQSSYATFIVTQDDHYNAPKYVWYLSNGEFLSGEEDSVLTNRLAELNSTVPPPSQYVILKKSLELTKPGFFIGVWSNKLSGNAAIVRDGWELLYEGPHARVGLPWFGNASGTSFVCSNGDQIDIADFAVTYIGYTQATGTSIQTLAGDTRQAVFHGLSATNLKYLYEYSGNSRLNGVANLLFSATSVPGNGAWGDSVMSYPGASPISGFSNFVTTYTDTSVDTYGVAEYCYVPLLNSPTANELATLPHYPFGNTLNANEISSGGPCIGEDWNGYHYGPGIKKAIRSQGSMISWEGELPGLTHDINTDFSITVCGVEIPINKTARSFKIERTPWLSNLPEIEPYIKCWMSEDCVSEKSTIYFLDERYGVCLYKTIRSEIQLPRKQNDELVRYVAYGSWTVSSVVIIRPTDYTATETETWYLVIDGVQTIIAQTALEIFPFGEPMSNDYYTDVCKVICSPRIPPSSSLYRSEDLPPGQTSAAGDFGTYEDAYGDPFGEQAQKDGGTDYFYPEWCRHLPPDPFWESAAASRYNFTAPAATTAAYGTIEYAPPEITVEPIPLGSFVHHPMLGDMYQFLISKFNGDHLVIGSASINVKIDDSLALAKDANGISLGLVTHDTTLYYPISIL